MEKSQIFHQRQHFYNRLSINFKHKNVRRDEFQNCKNEVIVVQPHKTIFPLSMQLLSFLLIKVTIPRFIFVSTGRLSAAHFHISYKYQFMLRLTCLSFDLSFKSILHLHPFQFLTFQGLFWATDTSTSYRTFPSISECFVLKFIHLFKKKSSSHNDHLLLWYMNF